MRLLPTSTSFHSNDIATLVHNPCLQFTVMRKRCARNVSPTCWPNSVFYVSLALSLILISDAVFDSGRFIVALYGGARTGVQSTEERMTHVYLVDSEESVPKVVTYEDELRARRKELLRDMKERRNKRQGASLEKDSGVNPSEEKPPVERPSTEPEDETTQDVRKPIQDIDLAMDILQGDEDERAERKRKKSMRESGSHSRFDSSVDISTLSVDDEVVRDTVNGDEGVESLSTRKHKASLADKGDEEEGDAKRTEETTESGVARLIHSEDGGDAEGEEDGARMDGKGLESKAESSFSDDAFQASDEERIKEGEQLHGTSELSGADGDPESSLDGVVGESDVADADSAAAAGDSMGLEKRSHIRGSHHIGGLHSSRFGEASSSSSSSSSQGEDESPLDLSKGRVERGRASELGQTTLDGFSGRHQESRWGASSDPEYSESTSRETFSSQTSAEKESLSESHDPNVDEDGEGPNRASSRSGSYRNRGVESGEWGDSDAKVTDPQSSQIQTDDEAGSLQGKKRLSYTQGGDSMRSSSDLSEDSWNRQNGANAEDDVPKFSLPRKAGFRGEAEEGNEGMAVKYGTHSESTRKSLYNDEEANGERELETSQLGSEGTIQTNATETEIMKVDPPKKTKKRGFFSFLFGTGEKESDEPQQPPNTVYVSQSESAFTTSSSTGDEGDETSTVEGSFSPKFKSSDAYVRFMESKAHGGKKPSVEEQDGEGKLHGSETEDPHYELSLHESRRVGYGKIKDRGARKKSIYENAEENQVSTSAARNPEVEESQINGESHTVGSFHSKNKRDRLGRSATKMDRHVTDDTETDFRSGTEGLKRKNIMGKKKNAMTYTSSFDSP